MSATLTAPAASTSAPTVLDPATIARIRKGLVGTLRDLRYSGHPKINPTPKLLRLTCSVPIGEGTTLLFNFEVRSDLALLIRPEDRAAEILRSIIEETDPDFDPTDADTLAAVVNSQEWKAA